MKTFHFPLQGWFRCILMLVTILEYLAVYLKILLLKVHFFGCFSSNFFHLLFMRISFKCSVPCSVGCVPGFSKVMILGSSRM